MLQCEFDKLDLPCTSCKERGKQCGLREKAYGLVGEKNRIHGQMEPLPTQVIPVADPTGQSLSGEQMDLAENGTHSLSCVAHW